MCLSHSGYGDWKNVMEDGSLGLSGNSSTAVSHLLEMQREGFLSLPVHFLYPPLCAPRSASEPMPFCTAKNLTLLLPKVVWCNLHSRILAKWLGWHCRSDSVIEWNSEQCPAKTLAEERYVFHRRRMTGMSLTLGHLNLCWSDGGFESVDISQSPCGGIKGVGLPLTL